MMVLKPTVPETFSTGEKASKSSRCAEGRTFCSEKDTPSPHSSGKKSRLFPLKPGPTSHNIYFCRSHLVPHTTAVSVTGLLVLY